MSVPSQVRDCRPKGRRRAADRSAEETVVEVAVFKPEKPSAAMSSSPTEPTRARSDAPTHRAWLFAGLVAALLFAGGWLLGRSGCFAEGPPGPPRADAGGVQSAEAAMAVELRLDAGGLTLMPEGGLELKPLQFPAPSATSQEGAVNVGSGGRPESAAP